MLRRIRFPWIVVLLAVTLAGCAASSRPTEAAAPATVEASTAPSFTASTGISSAAEPATARLTYPIVDTGQAKCYGGGGVPITCPAEGQAFYGQDAHYIGNAPNYTDNGNGAVTDNVTGLMWQSSPDTNGDGDIGAADKLTYDQALAGAEGLILGGYDDWRLPTIKELYSLIDFRGLDPSGYNGTGTWDLVPFIDTDYFAFAYGDTRAGERIIDAQYASSTKYVATTMNGNETMFGVNLADGRIKGYAAGPIPGQSEDKRFFVLYVRGNPNYGVNDLAANSDGTITDRATGLTWMQTDSGTGMVWEDALSYCENLDYAGTTDWRLPNTKELQSIVDYSRSPDTTNSAAIDPLFSVTAIVNEAGQRDYPFYWSSTTHANRAKGINAAYVAFGRSLGYMSNAWIDVHGAGAQRSDPKEGDPAAWPTGHGPQGDAIRIYNYARCVHGGTIAEPSIGGEVEPSTGRVATPPGSNAAPGQPPGPGRPAGVLGQPPDLGAAAAELGITQQSLRAALGDPRQGPPDLVAAAQQIGVSEEELREALAAPSGGPWDRPRGEPPRANEEVPAAGIPLGAQVCLDHTRHEGECKDCCDSLKAAGSLEADGATRKACRDACPARDFGQNTDFVIVDAPSLLGPAGDYSLCTTAGDERVCKDCCDASPELRAGDRRFCRDACAGLSSGGKPPQGTPAAEDSPNGRQHPPQGPQGQRGMNLEQAISDEAQRYTIAFDALAFLTGNLGADSFFPPGKVADFWGFQYLRDNDPSQMGHNTDFLTRAALNMLYVLTPEQRAELVTLAEGQVDSINEYGYNRFILMDAFRHLLAGDLPAGSTGLNTDSVQGYSADLYRLDGEMSFERAQVMGGILSELDAEQRAYLDTMAHQGMLDWPGVEEPSDIWGLDRDVKVAAMTYAGDMFSWYAGSVEADVYFCPERQGTYFGSFYLKDAPAMGNPDYTIPTNLTGDMGRALLEALTPSQASIITDLVEDQKPALYEIVDRRGEVATLLRQFMHGGTPDRATVLRLMERYGELDGEIAYRYATAFARVNHSLTAEQRAQLMALRTEMLGETLYPSGAYLYSQPIAMPEIPNTDFLFASP